MKGRWKWVFLTIGILLISATCGFGYEARATRNQYDEAKDAFAHKDWNRLVENLTYKNYPHTPSKKSLAAFLQKYVDPVISEEKYKLTTRKWDSKMVPIPNEEMAYEWTVHDQQYKFLDLVYSDDVLWFQMPIEGRNFGVFQGKQVTLSFYVTFFRVAFDRYPPEGRGGRGRSLVSFVHDEKDSLNAMGIRPEHVYSKAKTWDEFIGQYRQRALER